MSKLDDLHDKLLASSKKAELKAELTALRAERKTLIAEYGDKGQRHPMGRMIGGLNPAAQRLHMVRGHIAAKTPKRERAILAPKGSQRGWERRGGLLYDIHFQGRKGMIGRTQGAPPNDYYVIVNGEITSQGHRTKGDAAKAFERNRG
jgi:hypothetical protein